MAQDHSQGSQSVLFTASRARRMVSRAPGATPPRVKNVE
jgi:hypothetical protein